MGFAQFGDYLIRNNEDTGNFEIIHIPQDTRFEITNDGAFKIPRLVADKLEAGTEIVDGSAIDIVDLEDNKPIKLGTDNEWLVQYNSSKTQLEFIDDSSSTSQPKFTIEDGETPDYPQGLTVRGASVITESDDLQVDISNDGGLIVSDADSIEFGSNFNVSDQSTSNKNSALVSFASSEYVSTQTFGNHETNSSAHRTDSNIVSALANAVIDPSEVKTQSIFFGQLSLPPSDADIGTGNVALYFKNDGILYKRPYGGSESRVETTNGWKNARVLQASTDVVTSGDDVFLVDTSGGAVTVTVSTDDIQEGKQIVVKNRTDSASSNPVTVDTEGSAQIDGSSSITLSGESFARMLCDGTNLTLL